MLKAVKLNHDPRTFRLSLYFGETCEQLVGDKSGDDQLHGSVGSSHQIAPAVVMTKC